MKVYKKILIFTGTLHLMAVSAFAMNCETELLPFTYQAITIDSGSGEVEHDSDYVITYQTPKKTSTEKPRPQITDYPQIQEVPLDPPKNTVPTKRPPKTPLPN